MLVGRRPAPSLVSGFTSCGTERRTDELRVVVGGTVVLGGDSDTLAIAAVRFAGAAGARGLAVVVIVVTDKRRGRSDSGFVGIRRVARGSGYACWQVIREVAVACRDSLMMRSRTDAGKLSTSTNARGQAGESARVRKRGEFVGHTPISPER